MKCPICGDYFVAGEIKFVSMTITFRSQPWKHDECIRVCPGCYNSSGGVIIR